MAESTQNKYCAALGLNDRKQIVNQMWLNIEVQEKFDFVIPDDEFSEFGMSEILRMRGELDKDDCDLDYVQVILEWFMANRQYMNFSPIDVDEEESSDDDDDDSSSDLSWYSCTEQSVLALFENYPLSTEIIQTRLALETDLEDRQWILNMAKSMAPRCHHYVSEDDGNIDFDIPPRFIDVPTMTVYTHDIAGEPVITWTTSPVPAMGNNRSTIADQLEGLLLDASDTEDGQVSDLTQEGIEPNPGPVHSKPLKQTKAEHKRMVKENREYQKTLTKEARKGKKFVEIEHYEYNNPNFAQVGGSYVDVRQEPPQPCDRCGFAKCECIIKRTAVVASMVSILSSLIKIVESLVDLNKPNTNHAQIFRWFAAAGTEELIENANEALKSIPTKEDIAHSVSEIVEGILNAKCGVLPITVRTVLKALATMVVVYILFRMGVLVSEVASLICGLILPGTGPSLSSIFDDACHAQMGSFTDFTPTSVAELLPSLLSLAFCGLTAVAVNKVPGKDDTPTGWMHKMTVMPRACKAMADVYVYFKELLAWCWKNFQVKVLGYDAMLLDEAIPEIKDWLTMVEQYSHHEDLLEILKERTGRYRATHLYHFGDQLMIRYHTALTPEYRQAVQRGLQKAAKVKAYVEENYPEMKNVRSVPTVLWLVGHSQIGKSRLEYLIHAEMCMDAGIKDPEEVKRQMYMRCEEQDFWDGYCGQHTCVLDDAFQLKDSTSNPSKTPMELVRGVNPFPMALHMASLSQKAGTFFTSKFIMMSSNRKDIKIESITHEEALWNRLVKQSWDIRVKDEFALPDGRLDVPKARLAKPGWEINPEVYIFERFDPRYRNDNGGGALGEVVEWAQFIEQLKQDARDSEKGGAELDSWLTEYIKDRGENHAQVGKTHDIAQVYAQVGHGLHSLKHSLQDFADWIARMEVDVLNSPPREAYMTIYKSYMLSELLDAKEKGQDPGKVLLTSYQPDSVPEDMWELLVIAYFRAHDTVGDKIKIIMERCAATLKERISRLTPMAESIYGVLRDTVIPILKGVATYLWEQKWFVVIGSLFMLWVRKSKDTQPTSESTAVAESNPVSNQPRSRPAVRAMNRTRPVRIHQAGKAEMGKSLGLEESVACLRKQQYIMIAGYANGKMVPMGNVTNVTGSIFLMPRHFFTFMEEDPPVFVALRHRDHPTVVIKREYLNFMDEIYAIDHVEGPATDALLFSIKEFPRGRNLLRHFATREDLAKLHGRKSYGTLHGIDLEDDGSVKSSDRDGTINVLCDHLHPYILDEPRAQTVVATSIAEHNIPTKFGDCGKLMSINTDQLRGRIIGIHVSGSCNNQNYVQVVSRECIQAAVDEFDSRAQIGRELPSVLEGAGEPIDSGFVHVGRMAQHVPVSARTAIKPSKMSGAITEPITRPALLKPMNIGGKYHDPLVEGIKKAGVPCEYVPFELLEIAKKDVSIMVRSQFREDPPEMRVLTYEEAIQGIPADDLFQPINRTTSPGYPYMLQKKPLGNKGKTNWMGRFDYDFESEEALKLRHDVDLLEKQCMDDEPSEVIWIDTLKDERRSMEKVDAGKTRIISNGPMHYNILFRKYFLSALATIRHNRIHNGVCVGINVWSREWDFLAKYMTALSPHLIDGDFASFDGTIMDQVMWAIFEILDSMYDDGNTVIRRNLWYHAAYAVRSCRDVVYQCTHSLPSGFVATAEANSLYVNILFRVVYMHMARERNLPWSMSSFHENLRVVAYGDDNLVSIHPKIVSWFNMHSVIEAMGVFGMQYTPADKNMDNIQPYKTIDEVSFLKRKYLHVDSVSGPTSVRMCPADLASRLEMLNWTRARGVDSTPEEADVITEVLKELTMHGRKIYDEYAPRIVKAAISRGIVGFRDEGLGFYHSIVTMGTCVPRQCDLAFPMQNSDDIQRESSAIAGSGGSVYSYTLGSPGAALHHPRDRQCGEEVKWPLTKEITY